MQVQARTSFRLTSTKFLLKRISEGDEMGEYLITDR